jgi:hypothetical protein
VAIAIQCPECHKKYQAPDHMAGKRVKCKYCGVVFLIAADARSADAGADLSALDELNALGESARRKPAGRAPGAEDIDSLFQGAEYQEPGAPRTNKLYVFPLSRLLDHWLPQVLLVIGVAWMIREAFERNETGRTWVAVFRAGLFLLAFFASVLPFTLMGVRAAGRKLNFELPPRPVLRVMGVFAVPFALVCAMWLLNTEVWGPVMATLFGFVIGAAVALPVLFLLFRLLPVEAPVTFGYAAGSFLLSVVVSAASLFALNLMLIGGLRATKTEHALAASPFGPGLRWDAPPAPRRNLAANNTEPEEPEEPTTAPAAPDTGADTRPSATGPSTPTTRPAVVESPPTTPPVRDVVATGPNVSVNPGAMTEPPPDGGPADEPGERSGNGAQVRVDGAGGLVAGVRNVVPGDIADVVFPAVPGPWVAVVRAGRAGHDHVERWSTRTWEKTAELDVPRDQRGNDYALSPDGETLAYVSDFPRHAVQVWSFKDRRMLRQLPLDDGNGEAYTLGFTAPEQLLVQRRKGAEAGVQVWPIKAGRPRQFVMSDVDPRTTPTAISPDGQVIAFLVRGGNGADLESYAVATGRAIKQMPIVDVNWNLVAAVAGFAFTPDGQRIAGVFADGQGAGVYVEWPAAGRTGRAIRQPFLPVGVNPPAAHEGFGPAFEGRPMHWLDDGKSWLLWGSSVFDTDTGALLGELKVAGVNSQSTAGNTAYLLVADPFGGQHLDEVKLDLEKARKGGAAAPSRNTPAPAVRGRPE